MRDKAVDLAVSTATDLQANISQAVAAAGGTDPGDEFVNAWKQIEYNLHGEGIAMGAWPDASSSVFVSPDCVRSKTLLP